MTMKTINTIKVAVAFLLVGLMATSCMDGDWDAPDTQTAPYGNNSLTESNVITIKQLKDLTVNKVSESTANDTIRITEDWQLKARVTANDIQGNIYNEVALEDESGEGILVCIQKGGLYSFLPVGQQILLNLKDLYIGKYGNMPQIGTPYTNSSGRTFPSRMNFNTFCEHFKILGKADASLVQAEEFNVDSLRDVNYVKSHRGKLMTLKNVQLDAADGKKGWAPEDEKDAGNGVSRTVRINGKAQSLMVVRSSSYADFAVTPMPTGKVNLTGIFTVYATNPSRYGYTWQILLRSIDDVEEVN